LKEGLPHFDDIELHIYQQKLSTEAACKPELVRVTHDANRIGHKESLPSGLMNISVICSHGHAISLEA
jgi:hypothetical protein